jgi:hypothetical protein
MLSTRLKAPRLTSTRSRPARQHRRQELTSIRPLDRDDIPPLRCRRRRPRSRGYGCVSSIITLPPPASIRIREREALCPHGQSLSHWTELSWITMISENGTTNPIFTKRQSRCRRGGGTCRRSTVAFSVVGPDMPANILTRSLRSWRRSKPVNAGHTGSAFGRPECKLDPAIHVADKSAWTTGSSPVVTKNGRIAP